MKFSVPLNSQSSYCEQLRSPGPFAPSPPLYASNYAEVIATDVPSVWCPTGGGVVGGLRAVPLLLALATVYLVLQNPYALGLLFLATLSLTAGVVGSLESLLGLVVFIVYIGGAMVLFSYCFMLTPLQEGDAPLPVHPLPLLVLLGLGGPPLLSTLYDFYWVLSLLLLVGLLLFVVIVSVVEVIDLGRGTIRVT